MKRAKRIYWIDRYGEILEKNGKTHTEFIWDKFGKVEGDARDYVIENKNWVRVRLEEELCAIQAKTLNKEIVNRVLKTLPHNNFNFDLEINGNFYSNIPLEILQGGMLGIYPYKRRDM